MSIGSSLLNPNANEFDIMNRLQLEVESRLQTMKPLTLDKLALLLDDLEAQMASIDEEREKPIFVERLRIEWEDALLKRYVHKEKGELGTSLTPEEIKLANAEYHRCDKYTQRFESMRMQFMANQRHDKELETFKTMEEYMDTLFQKYQDNIYIML